MKKRFFIIVLCLIFLPIATLFSGCDASKESDVEIRIAGNYIQWSFQGENVWYDVIDVDSVKDALGEGCVGGKQVEFRRSEDYIQWRYVSEESWYNLISIDELKTYNSQDENPQQLAFYPLDDGTYGVGVGYATELSSIIIPEIYQGKQVTKIVDSGFLNCKIISFNS